MERIDKLKSFLEANPSDSFLKHALALEFIKSGEERTARQLLEELLTRDPAYVGSYYHLAKLLEKLGERELAIAWYEKGLVACQAAKDNHAYNELRGAYDDLVN